MFKKSAFIILGSLLVCWAWIGIVTSIEKEQALQRDHDFPLKAELVASKWEKVSQIDVGAHEEWNPAVGFLVSLEGLGLSISQAERDSELGDLNYALIKRTYLDAGRKASFFSYQSKDGKDFLVKVSQRDGKTELLGLYLDSVLNYLGMGMENHEWFLVDAKDRVVASYIKSYVGQPFTRHKGALVESFKNSGTDFSFVIPASTKSSLTGLSFLGVAGILFIALSLVFYQSNNASPVEAGVKKSSLVDSHIAKGVDFTIKSEEEEEMRMVSLSEKKPKEAFDSKKSGAKLNYSEFLIENPVLQGQSSISEVKADGLENSLDSSSKVHEATDVEEWMKIAADLSASIDDFAKKSKVNDSEKDQEI